MHEAPRTQAYYLHDQSNRKLTITDPGGEMLPEVKNAIVEFLGSNPGSCTREVVQNAGTERDVVYSTLCELEDKNVVERRGGLDGLTITFVWNLLD
jgi:predicted transcriptional regulator